MIEVLQTPRLYLLRDALLRQWLFLLNWIVVLLWSFCKKAFFRLRCTTSKLLLWHLTCGVHVITIHVNRVYRILLWPSWSRHKIGRHRPSSACLNLLSYNVSFIANCNNLKKLDNVWQLQQYKLLDKFYILIFTNNNFKANL